MPKMNIIFTFLFWEVSHFKNFFYYAGNIVLLYILHLGLSSLPTIVVCIPSVFPMCTKISNIWWQSHHYHRSAAIYAMDYSVVTGGKHDKVCIQCTVRLWLCEHCYWIVLVDLFCIFWVLNDIKLPIRNYLHLKHTQ